MIASFLDQMLAQHDITALSLFCQSLTILGNLCEEEYVDARQDVLRHRLLDIVVKVLSPASPCIQMYGLDVLDVTLWFISRISKSFSTRHLAVDSEWPLVCGLLQCLFLSE